MAQSRSSVGNAADITIHASSANQAISKATMLYHEVKQVIFSGATSEADSALDAKLAVLDAWVAKAEELHMKEPPSARIQLKQRIQQLRGDSADLVGRLETSRKQLTRRAAEDKRRQELLSTTFEAHQGDAYINMLGGDIEHNSRLQGANQAMDDLLAHGEAIKSTLYNQREMIKGTKRRLLDVAHTLGLSNTVMRLIEQRTLQDKAILYGGMLLTLVIMWILYSRLG
eukprot:m.418347 g.418347  ORF g.418347 m.418347 type:complete len:228 (+) comp30882_c0_seq1:51-734(+)